MKTALNRTQGRAASDGGMFGDALVDDAILATPEGEAVLARIEAATTEFYKYRAEHVRHVTLLVLKAKGF